VPVPRLAGTLSHAELAVVRVTEDKVRPRFHCRVICTDWHAPFAASTVPKQPLSEAAILVSRLQFLPREKVKAEIAYLQDAVEKTAGPAEQEAWGWLMIGSALIMGINGQWRN